MFAEARVTAAFETMIGAIEAPPVPTRDILRKMAQPQPVVRRVSSEFRFAIAAAAAIAIAFMMFPAGAVGLVQTIVVESYHAAYRVMGWTPPPNPRKSLRSPAMSQNVTLQSARALVPFTIVPPAGLPNDVVSSRIAMVSVKVYSKTTHSWQIGSPSVSFAYRRAGGRSFSLLAGRFDPQTGPPPKYMFAAEDLPGGKVALHKLPHFARRNGDQIISVTEDGISAGEIDAIRVAMRGTPVPGAEGSRLHSGTLEKQYQMTPP
jgi:hypothetical protein